MAFQLDFCSISIVKQAHVKCNLDKVAMPNALYVSESILHIHVYSHKFLYVMKRGITGIFLNQILLDEVQEDLY